MQFRGVEALKKKFRLLVMWFLFAGLGLGTLYAQTPPQTPTGIPKMDPAMDELIETNAQVEPVIKDFLFY
jgi:hypothetical protein